MTVSVISGGKRDYIELTAESKKECLHLVRVATSDFVPKDLIYLDTSGYDNEIRLRIFISPPQPAIPVEEAIVRTEHDLEA